MPSSDTDHPDRRPSSRPSIGIDVGGTKLLAVSIDPTRPDTPHETIRRSTPRGTGALLDALAELVDALDPAGDGPVGVGLPGLVDHGDRFRYGPNLPGVVDIDLGGALSARLDRSVAVDNDATCATVAEFDFGAGVDHDDGILLTIGTGIGAGVVVDGQIRRGANGFAGEPGHMVVHPDGPRCPCGRRGCWERFASGSGLGRLGREAAIAGRLDSAVALAGDPEAVCGEDVVAAVRAGDGDAAAVLDEFAWWLGLGIANLIDVLDPSVVILGGGVMHAADVLLDRVAQAVPDQVMGGSHRPAVPLVGAEAGESAGAVGAALIASRSVGDVAVDRGPDL